MSALISITDKEGKPRLWRIFVHWAQKQPAGFFIFLGLQFLAVLLAYTGRVGFGSALGLALLVDLFWLIIFIALPALMAFLLGLVIALLAVGITVFAVNALGINDFLGVILVFLISFVVIAFLFALATLVLYCLPGLIAAGGIYAATDSQGAAIAAFIIVTIITVALVYIFKEYILPFIFGFGLNWVALGLANQIALAIVLGASLAIALPGRGDFLDPYAYRGMMSRGFFDQIFGLLSGLFRLPTLVSLWAFASGIFTGLLNTPVREGWLKTKPAYGVIPAAAVPPAYPAAVTPPTPPAAPQPAAPTPAAYCGSCGQALAVKSSYCPFCGAPQA